MRAKYAYLLEDVRRWFDNLAAKSYLTATVYLRNLGFYCEVNGTSPKALLKVAGTKAFRDGFTDFVRRLGKQGMDLIVPNSRRFYISGSATMT